jgi:nicotinamide mononucleotide transporter
LLQAARPRCAAFTLLGQPGHLAGDRGLRAGSLDGAGQPARQPVAWPLAIASSLLYALLFADSRLYGEAGAAVLLHRGGRLGLVAVAARPRRRRPGAARARMSPARGRWLALAATLAAWPLLALLLDHATDSDVPWLDALPTVASITGQMLLGRKLVENWPSGWPSTWSAWRCSPTRACG